MSYFGSNQLIYNDKGQLSSFGASIYSYDRYGNRLTKTINNQIVETYTYERGKLLHSLQNANDTITFSYDYRGMRYQKDTKTETITYYYDNQKLIGEDHVGKTYGGVNYPSFKLRFFYDNNNIPTCLRYINSNEEKTDYIYIVNPFNEIIGLSLFANNPNSIIVTLQNIYAYDAWGNHKVIDNLGNEDTNPYSIGNINPLRYKGYYFDKETNLYYLISRYYDPSIGQFISPDDYSYLDINSISGYHLYAYCNNNPVMNYDPDGHLPDWAKWIIGGVAFAGAVALTYFTGGALTPVFIGMGISIMGGGVVQATFTAINGGDFWGAFAHGAAEGAMWGGIFAFVGATLRTIRMFSKGVAIGENVKRVQMLASSGGQITYNGMPGFKIISKIAGAETAQKLELAHNAHFIQRMMRWGVTIVDYGLDCARIGGRSVFYAMESGLVCGYEFLETMFFWGGFR